ncbi:MAG: toxin-antitoxin system HicB family antitoxin [Gammaproteobacteria bacterium]|nr:toxin-antitoxin system HicB family antitoxin [Gammaproteobacteria bacterium]MBU1556970.1 toxin-antitoxin system HicB family antitoxin [Gammaproteobacteria bacterium]MBU2069708.1 toxin-antitoxin system HicB family antitoxin [Gammaproteobacteria bacterium]MBU2184573.1 toxin-antitoxin system HicB family antitoxin [Gammaproteobacteria bacterium]MBU2205255.1 toxin-antitoxin system HicB family antitoxin [Gammaproteobacteria bacterium]
MTTLTIRMPDDKASRLKALAQSRNISVNKLIEELSTIALTEYDAQVRFEVRAARANATQGLALLDELEKVELAD